MSFSTYGIETACNVQNTKATKTNVSIDNLWINLEASLSVDIAVNIHVWHIVQLRKCICVLKSTKNNSDWDAIKMYIWNNFWYNQSRTIHFMLYTRMHYIQQLEV